MYVFFRTQRTWNRLRWCNLLITKILGQQLVQLHSKNIYHRLQLHPHRSRKIFKVLRENFHPVLQVETLNDINLAREFHLCILTTSLTILPPDPCRWKYLNQKKNSLSIIEYLWQDTKLPSFFALDVCWTVPLFVKKIVVGSFVWKWPPRSIDSVRECWWKNSHSGRNTIPFFSFYFLFLLLLEKERKWLCPYRSFSWTTCYVRLPFFCDYGHSWFFSAVASVPWFSTSEGWLVVRETDFLST